MSSWHQFAVALFAVTFPWVTLWAVMKYFLLAGNRDKRLIESLLARIEDLTAQVIAFKNPWAAEQFARFKSMAEQAPRPDKDMDLEDQLARAYGEVEDQELV
tara:strand:- start:164 stop:469 length:306 start_codon:yes stop_codon:yes gene_type:complete